MKNRKNTNIKLSLICTIGGHFEQLTNLESFYKDFPHFWITNKNTQTESALKNEKKYYIGKAHFSKPWEYLLHIPFIFKVFFKEKPTHIISTGSGRTALIPFFISKLFGINFILIETYSRVKNLTLFAKLLLKQNHPVLTQWENNQKNTIYIGPIFDGKDTTPQNEVKDGDFVFVTLGTRKEPYTRIIDYILELVKNNVIKEKVIVQSGHTSINYRKEGNVEFFDFCPAERIDELIQNSKYIITQESAGIVTKCLKYRKKFIVVPREFQYNELPTKSDMEEDLQFKMEEMGYTKVVCNCKDLEYAIKNLKDMKTGFVFDNSLAVSKLKELVVMK
jgi:beta-1,4-N-acetylglucosaminyltransferase